MYCTYGDYYIVNVQRHSFQPVNFNILGPVQSLQATIMQLVKVIAQQQQQPPFFGHYTGQRALDGTAS